MKEILDAIEATIRRVVREEMGEMATHVPAVAPSEAFGEVVKQVLMDREWFDEYIKAEVVTAVDDLAQLRPMPAPSGLVPPAPATPELFLRSEDFRNAVADAICNHIRTTHALYEVVDSRIELQALMTESEVERMIDNAVDDYVEKSDMPDMDDYVTREDMKDTVRNIVEDLSFTVSVD